MKKIIFSLLAIATIVLSSFGQSPEGFKYQAVVRDGGTVLNNQAVGIQITIQQGTIGGTAVYTETFAPTTNAYGLVNLEIGTGITTDDFTAIDWSAGPYFIETAVDVAGGTNYMVMGTSQLMSVPYALHAKTAGNGISTAQANEITANTAKVGLTTEQTTVLSNTSNTNTGDQDISGISSNTALIVALEARIAALEPQPAVIGEFRDGGVVFWVDPNDDTHGLVCALEDQGQIIWHNGSYVVTGATGTAIGMGEANTTSIINVQGATETDYAAGLAASYAGGGYTDWFLPSKDELHEILRNKATINTTAIANEGGSFMEYRYWSSSELNPTNGTPSVWSQNFIDGHQNSLSNKGNIYYVRAVRAF